ncbi:MAG: LptF/LptG family permease [Pirellulales bacterium]|nr:LptF/LptG family permease [Pirellulales bacterium]
MRILTRYIVFELLAIFLLTLTSMTVFVVLVLIGKEAVENGLGLLPILRMVPYILPQAMQFAVPGTMLLATTTVYGRIAASNEIVAVKSLGISPMTMLWPTFILATLVSLSAVVLSDVAVSWGRGGVQRIIVESLEEIIYGRLRTTRTYSNDRLKVAVQRVHGKTLVKPIITYFSVDDDPPLTITADEAELNVDLENNRVLITFLNANGSMGERFAGWFPGEEEFPFSLEQFTGIRAQARRTSNYSLREVGPAKQQQIEVIDRLKQEMSAQAAHALMTGRMYELSQDVWQPKRSYLQAAQRTLHRLHTEPHRRWASGFSCLCFVLIGAPMAVRLSHGDIWSSFFVCFLPILIIYYPMLVRSLDLAKDGVMPPQVVWLGNIVLALIGAWLVRRVVRF